MFVCGPCLKEHFTNEPGWVQSHGRCEMCEEHRICSDIPSRQLKRKPEPKPAPPHPKYRLNYFIDRADGQPLTDVDVSALEDDLWDVMVAWLEERGLRMNGGSGMTVPATGDDE